MSLLSKWLGEKTGGVIGDKPGVYSLPPGIGGSLPGVPKGALPSGIKPNTGGMLGPLGATGGYSGRGPGLDVGDVPLIGGLLSNFQDYLTGKTSGSSPIGDNIVRKYGYEGKSDAELAQLAAQGDQLAVLALQSRYSGPQLQAMGLGSILVKVAKGVAPVVAGVALEKGLDAMGGWFGGKKKHRHMNVLNPKALTRANRRVTGFVHKARPILKDLGYSFATHRHVKPKKKRR